MAGNDSALEAPLDRHVGQHLERLQFGAVEVVGMHVDRYVELLSDPKDLIEMSALVIDRAFGLSEAADRGGPPLEGLTKEIGRLRIRHDALLREGHNLDVNQIREAFTRSQNALERHQAGGKIDVALRTHPPHPVRHGELERTACTLLYILDRELALHLTRTSKGLLRRESPEPVPGQRLVDMAMRLNKRRGHEPTIRTDLAGGLKALRRNDRSDPPIRDTHVDHILTAAQPCIRDRKIHQRSAA